MVVVMLLACNVVAMMVAVDDASGGLAVAVVAASAAAVVRAPRRWCSAPALKEMFSKFLIYLFRRSLSRTHTHHTTTYLIRRKKES